MLTRRPQPGRRASRISLRLVVVGLLVVILPMTAAAGDSSALRRKAHPAARAPQPVPGRTLLGAFASLPGEQEMASVKTLEGQLGRRLALDSHYYNWDDPFPGSAERADAASGRTPMETWWGTSLRRILNGSQDALIRRRAAAVRAYGKPVFIRWGAEMNGDWYAWSGARNDKSPELFVAAWRHIHNLFAAAHVRNVAWVWAPNADSKPGGIRRSSWNNWRKYYPGDKYVDWVGIDGYNWGSRHTWQSFGQIFGPVYADYAGRKPIMIAETSSVETGGSKAAWIKAAGRWMKRHRGISAVVWFDTDRSASGIDWRLNSSGGALAAVRELAHDPHFDDRPLPRAKRRASASSAGH